MEHGKITPKTRRGSEFFHVYCLGSLLAVCGVFYYFGEIVDLLGWHALDWSIFTGIHDVHRLLFLVPVMYAGYVFGRQSSVIITIVSSAIMLPRALFISPFPDPIARMALSILVIGAVGYFTAVLRRTREEKAGTEAEFVREKNKLTGVLASMQEGVMIVGPDYRVRFANPRMLQEFGVAVGEHCYSGIYGFDAPCPEICRLRSVLGGSTERIECIFPDGRAYDVIVSPYADENGEICQLSTYRDIGPGAER